MAGVDFQVEVEDETSARLDLLARTIGDMTPVMRAIGGKVQESIDLNFTGEHDPYGVPWEEISEATVLNRLRRIAGRKKGKALGLTTKKGHTRAKVVAAISSGKSMKILRDTGTLADSITTQFGKDFVEAGVPKSKSGTSMEYAATHQFGDDSRNIPKRQFLPFPTLPRELEDEISEITSKFIERALR